MEDFEDVRFLLNALDEIENDHPDHRMTLVHWNKHEGVERRLELCLDVGILKWQLDEMLRQSVRWRSIVDTVRECLAKDE